MGRVVVLGVFVADTAYRADRLPKMGETLLGKSFALGPGGKGSNQAVACARIGADTHIISKLGKDDFAEMAHATWSDAQVIAHVEQVGSAHPGAALIFVDAATGDNAIIIAPGAGSLISGEDLDAQSDLIRSADVFVTQLEQPLSAALRGLQIAKAASVTTILNPAPARELPAEIFPLCDYITPNETEAEALVGMPVQSMQEVEQAALRMCELGVGVPVITLGERGAYLHGYGLVPAISAGPVVETTGAGDAFNGGFAAALARGKSPLTAVRIGCATAGLSVTRPGTAGSMPTWPEVQKLLN